MSRENALTLKQEKFCQYYVDIDGNASEAYRMAYDCSKMKQESVWRNAHALMQNIKVTSRIKEIREKRARDSEVKRETVERVLMDIITADPCDLYIVDEHTGKVKMKSPSQLPKRTRNALKKIQNDRGKVTYEFNGKTEAARLLGVWNGWEAAKNINIKSGDGDKISELRIGFDENDKSDE